MKTRRALAWLMVLLAVGVPSAGGLAGTTGSLRGRVLDAVSHAPLAGVTVSIASPSQAAHATTDASGVFTFLSLSPDTYVLSLTKPGYDASTINGITIVSDQNQTLSFDLTKTLRTIGTVRARASTDVVRPGATSDVYSINSATQQAATAVGGPGGVDYGYSGLATVPGLYILQGQQGWQQLISVRGGDPGDVAVELDGIPMARSSDAGTASTLSSLGQQELQAYTGGTPASADANGLSGYINQVIRTGTYPGFATGTLGIGGPAFYHKASFELGGATKDRNFSYYLATSGVNQDYRYCGQDLCGSDLSHFFSPLAISEHTAPGIPLAPIYDGSAPAYFVPGATYALASTADRESIANIHVGIPHHVNEFKDDVQVLYVNSEIFAKFYSSIGDLGGLSYFTKALGAPTYTDYDYYTGQVFGPPNPALVQTQYFPSSPTNRQFFAPLPVDLREGNSNGVSVIKLQYQKNINASSYLRVFGYTNYSNWFINGPVSEFFNFGGQIGDFEITEHAYGFKGIYQNQLTDKHLLGLTTSYQQQRNTTYSSNIEGIVTTNLVDSKGNCYNFSTGNYASCFTPVYLPPTGSSSSWCSSSSSSNCVPILNPAGGLNEYTQYGATLPGFPPVPTLVPGNPPPGSPAARNAARWLVTNNGAWTDQYDNNIPITSSVALTDQWHPNDRLVVNAGVRAEWYTYDIGATSGAQWPARPFWFGAFNRENCYASGQPTTTQRTIDPLTGQPSACPAGSAPTNLANTPPSVASYSSFLPRLGFTYTLSRDSVLRGSFGRYADAPSSSDEAVNAVQQDLASALVTFLPAGFNTPFHNEHPALASNYDLSLEQRLKNTDYSFKVTPFYRTTSDQIESVPLGFQGDVLGLNVGFQKSYGLEFLLSKGAFDRDGLSWQLSYAYTKSTVRYADGPTGTNFIDSLNTYIQHYNSFTKACAGGNSTLCGSYGSSNAKPTFTNSGATVANPYYGLAPQALLDRNAEYAPYTILPSPYQGAVGYDTPSVLTALVNYRRGRLTLTPSVTYTSGSNYGSPLVWPGYDPTTCTAALPHSTKANTQFCSQGSIPLFIPDPYTGHFDQQGSLLEPSRLTGNLQIAYQATKNVSATLALTSLFDSCYQRGYAWDNSSTCVYGQLPSNHLAPVGNFVPLASAPIQLRYPYSSWLNNEWVGYVGQRLPFTAFLSVQFKL